MWNRYASESRKHGKELWNGIQKTAEIWVMEDMFDQIIRIKGL